MQTFKSTCNFYNPAIQYLDLEEEMFRLQGELRSYKSRQNKRIEDFEDDTKMAFIENFIKEEFMYKVNQIMINCQKRLEQEEKEKVEYLQEYNAHLISKGHEPVEYPDHTKCDCNMLNIGRKDGPYKRCINCMIWDDMTEYNIEVDIKKKWEMRKSKKYLPIYRNGEKS